MRGGIPTTPRERGTERGPPSTKIGQAKGAWRERQETSAPDAANPASQRGIPTSRPEPSTARGHPTSLRQGQRGVVLVAPANLAQSTSIESSEQLAARLRARRRERNVERLLTVNASDAEVAVGESTSSACEFNNLFKSGNPRSYLDTDPTTFFPPPEVGPDDTFDPPDWFLAAVSSIARSTQEAPDPPPIVFTSTVEAAQENAKTLKSFDYDLGKLIREFSKTTLGYGSEFRPTALLRPLLGRHPNFNALEDVIDNGMRYVFTRELDVEAQRKEMLAILERGNHQSAKDLPEQVSKLLDKDVVHGFTIPLPITTVRLIPNAGIQPLGLASQWTIDENGERVIKYRLTQDLTFSSSKSGPPMSINKRIDMTAYTEMIYGWCLPRIIHFVVALRWRNPYARILVAKYDYSDAYRRIAHSASAATQTIAIQEPFAYLSLRLTFGGSPNPPTWCMFSEIVTDLANEISLCQNWDPATLHSPAQPTAPAPIRMDATIPIAVARSMAVTVATEGRGECRVDGFIDDLINVFLDTPENCTRQPHVVPLAMHVTSRPHAGDEQEPLPRRAILSQPKLIAEGSPAESQTVLGWNLDTRRLLLSLPKDKYEAWTQDIEAILLSKSCRFVALEQLIGRLNHTSHVLPTARHFLTRLRHRIEPRYRNTKQRRVALTMEELEDLVLWKAILSKAYGGVSLNLLVTRQPNRICWSDACPFGIGGYNLDGRAWRIQIPADNLLRGNARINNLLEFIGMAVNIWLECVRSGSSQDCILAIGDNTSAIGWLHNTSRLDPKWPAHRAHLIVARHVAHLLMDNDCCLGTQHVKGELNVVADLLSFVGEARGKPHPLAFDDPPNDILSERFHLSPLSNQIPANFQIHQLPDEMLSWVSHVLQIAASSLTAVKKEGTRPTTESGEGGSGTAPTSGTVVTPSSLCYPTSSATWSPSPSFSATAPVNGPQTGALQESVSHRWASALSAKPQATWQRRFGAISGKAPCTSREEPTCARSSDNYSKPSRTSTPQPDSNER